MRNDLLPIIDKLDIDLVLSGHDHMYMRTKQVENEGFKADILAWMTPDTLYAAGDIMKGVPSIVDAGMSINRVSALMTQLKDAGAVTVTVDKRKNFYALA